MTYDSKIGRVLCKHLHDPSSSFSVGSFGVIAEFHRNMDEPLTLDDPERLTIATDRGALRIDLTDNVRPLAYETLSGRSGHWQHGVVFCLPKAHADGQCQTTLTELGPDRSAVRTGDRDAILFDMGLGAKNVDFCVRTKDPALLSLLRRAAGRSVLEPGSPIMAAIVDASPHRICISRLARAEVYQPIDKVKTPEGPHTHVLPKFLKSGRTHSANIPVPTNHLPCLSLYPANPLIDGNGRDRPFDKVSLSAFKTLLDEWGAPDYRTEKARVITAIRDGKDPDSYECLRTRLGRTALRIALRQLSQSDHDKSLIRNWSLQFDTPKARATEFSPTI